MNKINLTFSTIMILLLVLPSIIMGHSGGVNQNKCHKEGLSEIPHCHKQPSKKLEYYSNSHFRRKSYSFKTYKYHANTKSFYIGSVTCKMTVDHVVALKDIHESGGYKFDKLKKAIISNDQENHVPACSSINKSKGASSPFGFFLKSQDKIGLDYKFADQQFCKYVRKYYQFKVKYSLSFVENDPETFKQCGLKITLPKE